MRTIVVTGTDTDVGKTVAAAALTIRLGARYWKPIQSGIADGTDSATVARLACLPPKRVLPEHYRLHAPLSPHRAAELDGVAIDPKELALPAGEDALVIEGAGGVLVPLTRDMLFADLFARWGAPVVLVARTTLGTINHSLLSIEALHARGVPLAGILFNGDGNQDNERTIVEMGGVAHLGRLPRLDPLTPESLATAASGLALDGILA